ncbi:MAG TPA: hypothetical protein VFW75_12380 [Acetobacteraceae bacterium]|nr:hypothetical protein [Acetobacteraceae bacterium]
MSSSTAFGESAETAPHVEPVAIVRRRWRRRRRTTTPARDLLWAVLVRTTDALLRRWYGVREFTDDPTCLFRVSRAASPHDVELSDGTRIGTGEPIAVLHIWNEQLPRFSLMGPDFRWALLIRRRMLASFRELARHLDEDPGWADVQGIHACVTFGNLHRRWQIRSTAARFGVELIDVGVPNGLHELGEDALIWAFARAFNPAALRRHCFRRDRTELWISRARLLARYR